MIFFFYKIKERLMNKELHQKQIHIISFFTAKAIKKN